VDTVPIDVALLGEKLIDRDLVDLAYVLDRHPVAHAFGFPATAAGEPMRLTL
jgi:hypothetical protein